MAGLLSMGPFYLTGYHAWRHFGWPGVVLDVALACVIFVFVLQRVPLEPLEERKAERSPEEW